MSSKLIDKKTAGAIFLGAAVLVATLFAVLAMSAAVPEGSPVVENRTTYTANPVPQVQLPVINTEGTWIADSGNGAQFVANVQGGMITINLENEGVSMTYWSGTFVSTVESGASVMSTKDESQGPVLSGSDEKEFVVRDNGMEFEFTAMNMTRTVVLTRG